MKLRFLKRALIVVLLDLAAGAAFAQFVWIDATGTRQYSDQPPPASVPKTRVLKEPAAELRSAKPAAAAAAAAAPGSPAASGVATAAVKPPPTLADKNSDFLKRQAEKADKEKKAAEELQLAMAKTKNCERAHAYEASLKSGERITGLDKNGEKSFLSDERRAQESAENRRTLESCK